MRFYRFFLIILHAEMIFNRNKVQNMNKILAGFVMAAMTTTAFAQSNSYSPYSQYGLGDLTDQSVGFNKGMNGVGVAMRKGNEVNPMNPASYSSVDSLSMLFDAGLSGQMTKFEEGGARLTAKGGGFDYVTALFRAWKHVGVSFGIMPYSNIGYDYSLTTRLPETNASVVSNYEGNGGLHELFLGGGWNIIKPLSLGFNISYLWGEYDRKIYTSSSSSINNLSKQYKADISSYRLTIGAQYDLALGKNNNLVFGATWSPGHNLESDAECLILNRNSSISKSDTTLFVLENALALPDTYGFGVSFNHSNVFRVGADLTIQEWGSVDFPHFDGKEYKLKSGLLKDSYRMNGGLEWTPRAMSRRFLERVRYRIGAGYATPYYNINGKEGPEEYSASIGFGIPIINGYNNRSLLNISAQWVHRSADNLLTENTFRINIGLTFNERWFAKWKVE